LMVAGRGIAQLIVDGEVLTVYYPPFAFLGTGFVFGLPFALWLLAAVFAALHLVLRRTALGLLLRAIGHNPAAAHVAGIRTHAITLCAYIGCALSAALAGVLVAANVNSADANNAGLMLELDAILAVALGGSRLNGGQFSLAGSVVGALIIQTLTTTIYSTGAPPQLNLALKAGLVFVVMLLQSADFRAQLRGLLTRREPRT